MRTFLRLEHLLIEAEHHLNSTSRWNRSAGLRTVLDILSILGRSDQRTEVTKELEMQAESLSALQNRPGVDGGRLSQVLDDIHDAISMMNNLPPHAALFIRDHDFLGSVVNRSAIPGGTCGFDLPGFHRWLSQPAEIQQRDLDGWYQHIAPYDQALQLIVGLIRDSSSLTDKTAKDGVFVQNIEQPAQMVRVMLPSGSSLYPEISAGKYRCTLRFMLQDDINARPVPTQENVAFKFALCSI